MSTVESSEAMAADVAGEERCDFEGFWVEEESPKTQSRWSRGRCLNGLEPWRVPSF